MTLFICLTLLFVFTPTGPAFSAAFTNSLATIYEDHDYTEGREALIAHDYQKAIESFNRLVERKPKEFKAQYYLGLSYLGAKQYQEAIAAFQRAAEINSKPPFAQYELGKTYLEMENYEAALAQYRWLQGQDLELASYLLDLLPKEMIEQHNLSPSLLVSSVQEKEDSNGATKSAPQSQAVPMMSSLRPNILYKEKARYTDIARTNIIRGTVVLNLVFASNGNVEQIRVIRGLPDGLTRSAIEAVKKMRFDPAIKDGQPVSVRGNVEFNFTLY